ncbi:unnamed protein product, partial [Rotaria sordida]
MTSYLDVATSKMGNERSDNNVFRESTDSTSVDASVIQPICDTLIISITISALSRFLYR